MRSSILILLLFSFVLTQAQTPGLPLNFRSYAINLCVAKDESVTMTTRVGEVGIADSITTIWRRADVETGKDGLGLSGPLLDQPNFFNKDTGIVSGFISGKGDKYNLIYRTTDGGKKWVPVNFGQDGWVDDATNLDNGEAWLSVSGSGIAYSNDYGASWKKFNNPEPKQRFAAIYFNTSREGIMGSLWNLIAFTPDNCKTWKFLPTPLDQGKYVKSNKEARPELNNVAIFKDYFLACQEDLVFYTRRDSINWVWLKDFSAFYTDPENSALFFKTNDGSYIRSDNKFNPIHSFETKADDIKAKCKNGSLFVVSRDKMVKLNPQNQIVNALFTTNSATKMEPVYIGYTTKGGMIGARENKLFYQKDYNGAWDYLFTFPFPLSEGELTTPGGNSLLYDRGDDSLFYFNLAGKLIKQESKLAMIENFCKAGIKSIVFSQGSQGCFHHYEDKLTYTKRGGEFGDAVEESHNGKGAKGMPENDKNIAEQEILDFLKKLPAIFNPDNTPAIDDLAFTSNEYEKCKRDILKFQSSLKDKKAKETSFTFNRNNLDFNRLLALVDTIKTIDKKRLNYFLLRLTEGWSTTTNWKKMQLVNNNKEELIIVNNSSFPNAFYFPWTVSLNGYRVSTTNIEINRFIDMVYPAFLNKEGRVDVLYSLVKGLY